MDLHSEVPLVESGHALDSMRNSDFDVCSAYGEVVDNSLQANATRIRVQFKYEARTPSRKNEPIESVAFGDDGYGMDSDVLHHCLQLGYSSRFNDRSGIGRFGVGATLAALNQCKRVEIYSKTKGTEWLWTYFDLDEIESKQMTGIPYPVPVSLPAEYEKLTGTHSGTVVIWEKYDRQPDDASDIIGDFETWAGRTYRKFIEKGVEILINGKIIFSIDPLFVLVERTRFPDDPVASEYPPMMIKWPIPQEDRVNGGPSESVITIKMSLLPEELRKIQGAGNSKAAIERHIPENEGISILRNGREVFYDHVPHWPGNHFAEIDRWWGCEVSFDAVLDREFTVKNIKRGAVPARMLKKTLAEQINPTRSTALEKVREVWEKAKAENRSHQPGGSIHTGHEDAEEAAKNTPAPKGVLDADKDSAVESVKLTEQWMTDQDDKQKAAWQAKFRSQPFTIMDADWRGPEFVETSHLGGSDVLRYNMRHAFFSEIESIRNSIEQGVDEQNAARRLKALIDLLLISYAKSETMIDPSLEWDPQQLLETLRMQWGHFLSSYINTYRKENDLA